MPQHNMVRRYPADDDDGDDDCHGKGDYGES